MRVEQIMSPDPACCSRTTSLQEVAQMMRDHNCGEIPVVESVGAIRRPIGVVTDRDIVCRSVARGLNPLELQASDCMTEPCITVTPDMSVEQCCDILEENQIRRVPVVDAQGSCCGIVALADVALRAQDGTTAEVVREVSEPASVSSRH
jgi:CBS domain-containing protein